MTRVDFYTNVTDPQGTLCRLIRKATLATDVPPHIVVLTGDQNTCEALDQALWSFSPHDFLPHVRADDALADQTPIILMPEECPPAKAWSLNILMNLSTHLPTYFEHYRRVIEIIAQDPVSQTQGRARYRAYREHGCALNHVVM